jgi:hypothetical protein
MLCSIAGTTTLDREWRTPWTQNESNRATYKKNRSSIKMKINHDFPHIPWRTICGGKNSKLKTITNHF